MDKPEPRTVYHADVASHIPGRLRVRLHRKSRQPSVLRRLKHELTARPGVHGVEVNHAAGSVTVTYDAQAYQGTGILRLLKDLDVIVGTMLEVPHLEASADERGHSQAALTLAEALDDLNQRLSWLTGHTLDLRVLFPLSLAGVGAWLIWKKGLMLETLPGWLLLWLAFDAFVKLHFLAPPSAPTEGDLVDLSIPQAPRGEAHRPKSGQHTTTAALSAAVPGRV